MDLKNERSQNRWQKKDGDRNLPMVAWCQCWRDGLTSSLLLSSSLTVPGYVQVTYRGYSVAHSRIFLSLSLSLSLSRCDVIQYLMS